MYLGRRPIRRLRCLRVTITKLWRPSKQLFAGCWLHLKSVAFGGFRLGLLAAVRPRRIESVVATIEALGTSIREAVERTKRNTRDLQAAARRTQEVVNLQRSKDKLEACCTNAGPKLSKAGASKPCARLEVERFSAYLTQLEGRGGASKAAMSDLSVQITGLKLSLGRTVQDLLNQFYALYEQGPMRSLFQRCITPSHVKLNLCEQVVLSVPL